MTKSTLYQANTDLFGITETVTNSPELIKFRGTDKIRFLRVLHALLLRPLPREHVDRVAGCSNAPDLISKLRDLGLGKAGLLCTMIKGYDRDGKPIRFGVYSLSEQARKAINSWMAKRDRGTR